MSILDDLPLGKDTEYPSKYDPGLLCKVPRSLGRSDWSPELLDKVFGYDEWFGFELSFILSNKMFCTNLIITVPASSLYLVESKSLKLYLYSFRNETFADENEVKSIISKDLSTILECSVSVEFFLNKDISNALPGINIDNESCDRCEFLPNPAILKVDEGSKTHTVSLNTNLFKSNCLVTGQPDWGSVYISYTSKNIIGTNSLLKYLVSFRRHQGFHEHCVETIFFDLFSLCRPNKLTVYAQYTRRGGLAIAPYRSTSSDKTEFPLLVRT